IFFGTTVLYTEAKVKDVTKGSYPSGLAAPAPSSVPPDFSAEFHAPSAGVYAALTRGPFFIDAQVLGNYYQMEFSTLSSGLFDQRSSARGITVTSSAGYNFQLGNNWFIEPSASVVWARTWVDP